MSNNLKDCFKTNVENPYGNFLSGSNNENKNITCDTKENKKEEFFYQGSMLRSGDLKYTKDFTRKHYTQPNTTMINDQTSFAKFLYQNTSKCRDDGYSCKLDNQISKSLDRTIILTDYYKPNYLDIFGVYNSYK